MFYKFGKKNIIFLGVLIHKFTEYKKYVNKIKTWLTMHLLTPNYILLKSGGKSNEILKEKLMLDTSALTSNWSLFYCFLKTFKQFWRCLKPRIFIVETVIALQGAL